MADSSVPLEIKAKEPGGIQEFQMDADILYKGTMVKIAADGYLMDAASEAGSFFAGIAAETKDNSGGSAGDLKMQVYRKGRFLLTFSDTLTIADVGSTVYATDNQTATVTSGASKQIVGQLVEFVTASTGWVDIDHMNHAAALGT